MSRSTALQDRIARFVEAGGTWHASLDSLVHEMPGFVEAWLAYAGRPLHDGPLAPKTKALIGFALNAAMTHLNEAGIRTHLRHALRCGASRAELLEVLQLVSVMAVHACTLGVPILAEQLEGRPGGPGGGPADDARRAALRDSFETKRGYWSPMWEALLAVDPDYFEAFIAFSGVPWEAGVLEPKVKEFVYIAVAVSATHQFVPGTRIHVKNALGYGASAAELLEVMQIASAMGIQSFAASLPLIDEEIARHRAHARR
ncbi:MAG: carboxymuconolactone decarboxylase family protein [Burkholderia sp.]